MAIRYNDELSQVLGDSEYSELHGFGTHLFSSNKVSIEKHSLTMECDTRWLDTSK